MNRQPSDDLAVRRPEEPRTDELRRDVPERHYHFYCTDDRIDALNTLLPALGIDFCAQDNLIRRSPDYSEAFVADNGPELLAVINSALDSEDSPRLLAWPKLDLAARDAVLTLALAVVQDNPGDGFRMADTGQTITEAVEAIPDLRRVLARPDQFSK